MGNICMWGLIMVKNNLKIKVVISVKYNNVLFLIIPQGFFFFPHFSLRTKNTYVTMLGFLCD